MKIVGITLFLMGSVAFYLLGKTNDLKKLKTPIVFDSLVVLKHLNQLRVYSNHQYIKTYTCGVGSNPKGHKQKQGDNRTPEGIYQITARNAKSDYYKNLHINYPNAADKARCKKLGVDPGGDIKIHGTAPGYARNIYYSYTWGCIAVCNNDMDELFAKVKTGATINILP